MLIQKNRIIYVMGSIFFILFSIFTMIGGLCTGNIQLMCLAVFCIWIGTFLVSLSKEQRNFIFIFLLITFFIFLLSRVMVRWITLNSVYMPFNETTMVHIYTLLYISLAGLLVGSFGKIQIKNANNFLSMDFGNNIDLVLLRKIVAPITVMSGFAQLATTIERIFYYQVGMGGALRISFSSVLPSIVTRFSNIYILMMAIYLATFPSKKGCMKIFFQYLIINALKMIYGSRSDFMLGIMFLLLYFIIRERLENEEEDWIGKKEIGITLISIPLLIVLIVFVGSYRIGGKFQFTSFTRTLFDFFESQGTSIDVLGYAYEKADMLPKNHFLYLIDNTYTFFATNPISSFLFGTHNYPVNTVERALYGTSLDQTLYYIINPVSYLNGFGCGSSYVAETYLAFGYVGTFIFNIVFSYVLNKINDYSYQSFLKNVLLFVFLQSLFFIPRSGFDDFVGDFATVTHIFIMIGIWCMYNILINRKNKNLRSE